jgi:hypothetical protein
MHPVVFNFQRRGFCENKPLGLKPPHLLFRFKVILYLTFSFFRKSREIAGINTPVSIGNRQKIVSPFDSL